jgi:hypothetical protein
VVQRTLTNAKGKFRFENLIPDKYGVRVALSTFVPAVKNGISVEAGIENILNIQLANIFSTIELVYTAPGQAGVLSDDWKWTLRSAGATRPVLRYLPRIDVTDPAGKRSNSVFSATRGMVNVSAGDGYSSTFGSAADLGTAFALATTVFGANEIRVAGNMGYATATGTPAAAFRTRYGRNTAGGLTPDVELTVQQLGLRGMVGTGLMGGVGSPQDIPVMRSMSVKVMDQRRLTEELGLEYGALMETVAFLERLNSISPFARLTYELNDFGTIEAAYASGAPPVDLLAVQPGMESSMAGDVAGLGVFPRLSLLDGRVALQRNETYEIGYKKVDGSRTFTASVYQDRVKNAAMLMAAPAGMFASGDLLPDIASNSSIFNLGTYSTLGYMASYSQGLGDNWTATVAGGYTGMLAPNGETAGSAEDVRSQFEMKRREWASARLTGLMPGSGTRVAAVYVWTPGGTLGPSHAFLTQRWQPMLGLNVQVRQPLPSMNLMPGRLEMNAEVRNLLAAGYVPVMGTDGRSVYLIQFPRTLRGGLSFIF